MSDCSVTASICGRTVLFCGINTQYWSISQYVQAAKNAKSWGVDSLAIKVADGTDTWPAYYDWPEIHQACNQQGVGAIPYAYLYAWNQLMIQNEVDILAHVGTVSGVVCADIEDISWTQYNFAQLFSNLCRSNLPCKLILSTYANWNSIPDWEYVMQAMAPAVDAWGPQVYSDNLNNIFVNQHVSFCTCVYPEIDLTQEFGQNYQPDIVWSWKDGPASKVYGPTLSYWYWYYDAALQNPQLLQELIHLE